MPYLIRHKDGREYEVASVADYRRLYEDDGFKIVDDAPADYDAAPKQKAQPSPTRATHEPAAAAVAAEGGKP